MTRRPTSLILPDQSSSGGLGSGHAVASEPPRLPRRRGFAAAIAEAICLGMLTGALAPLALAEAGDAASLRPTGSTHSAVEGGEFNAGLPRTIPSHRPERADFGREQASAEAHSVADWVVHSHDNGRRPFMIVDKKHARVFAFDPDGRLRGAAPALLGLARGDDSVPGIGTRKLASMLPAERTTPAGRFVAALGRNSHGVDILWVDYDAAISLHRVIKGKPAERRAARLASASSLNRRITYGCINVPASFFDQMVGPAFAATDGIVYVLPETRQAGEVFGSYDVDERTRLLEHPQPRIESALRPGSAALP